MTGAEIITYYRELTDDQERGDTILTTFMNASYDRLNMMRDWHYLHKTDNSTHTIVAATTSYAHPSDMLYFTKLKLYSASTGYESLLPVSFRHRRKYDKVSGYFYDDAENGAFVLTWSPTSSDAGKTLEIDYQYQPALLTTSTSPVFNRTFHPIVAYDMAKHYWYNEQDEKARSWTGEMAAEYNQLMSEMKAWDARRNADADPSAQPADEWLDLED